MFSKLIYPVERERESSKNKERNENFWGFRATWTFLFSVSDMCAKNCLGLTRTIHSAWTTASIQFHSTSTSLLIKHIKWCHKNWKLLECAHIKIQHSWAPHDQSTARRKFSWTHGHTCMKWSECEKQRSIWGMHHADV